MKNYKNDQNEGEAYDLSGWTAAALRKRRGKEWRL